ncbi:hypothetical protein C8T65DRAFT_644689 [Cerioporus squamosus]|nr:hypothetical protein C8T65DRAFT_644689 [Cerioporus squamosus]
MVALDQRPVNSGGFLLTLEGAEATTPPIDRSFPYRLATAARVHWRAGRYGRQLVGEGTVLVQSQ